MFNDKDLGDRMKQFGPDTGPLVSSFNIDTATILSSHFGIVN